MGKLGTSFDLYLFRFSGGAMGKTNLTCAKNVCLNGIIKFSIIFNHFSTFRNGNVSHTLLVKALVNPKDLVIPLHIENVMSSAQTDSCMNRLTPGGGGDGSCPTSTVIIFKLKEWSISGDRILKIYTIKVLFGILCFHTILKTTVTHFWGAAVLSATFAIASSENLRKIGRFWSPRSL